MVPAKRRVGEIAKAIASEALRGAKPVASVRSCGKEGVAQREGGKRAVPLESAWGHGSSHTAGCSRLRKRSLAKERGVGTTFRFDRLLLYAVKRKERAGPSAAVQWSHVFDLSCMFRLC